MIIRSARGKTQATMVLLIVLIVLSGAAYFWVHSSSNERFYARLDFISAILVEPVSVGGAGWQIKLSISNTGNQDAVLKKIYVNNRLVVENGLIHGEELSSSFVVGSSLLKSGSFIQPGKSETIFLWIGSGAYRKGELLTIDLQSPEQIDLKKTITLD